MNPMEVVARARRMQEAVNELGAGRPSPDGRCPIDPKHGKLIVLSSGNLYCGHSDHMGRPASHPQGSAPVTRNLWES